MNIGRTIAMSFATRDAVVKKGIGERIRKKVKKLTQKIGSKRSIIRFLNMKREKQIKLLHDMRELKDLKDRETQQAKKDADAAKAEKKRLQQLIDGLMKDLEIVERECDANTATYEEGVNEVSDMANKIDFFEECYAAQSTEDCLMYAAWDYGQIQEHIHVGKKEDILKLSFDDTYWTVLALDSYGLKYNEGHTLGDLDLHKGPDKDKEHWQKYLANLLHIDWEQDTKRTAQEMLNDNSDEAQADEPPKKKCKTDQTECP